MSGSHRSERRFEAHSAPMISTSALPRKKKTPKCGSSTRFLRTRSYKSGLRFYAAVIYRSDNHLLTVDKHSSAALCLINSRLDIRKGVVCPAAVAVYVKFTKSALYPFFYRLPAVGNIFFWGRDENFSGKIRLFRRIKVDQKVVFNIPFVAFISGVGGDDKSPSRRLSSSVWLPAALLHIFVCGSYRCSDVTIVN